jgi:hypothetical protein
MNADAVRSPPAMLINLNGIGPEIAAVLWSEGLYRSFANRKQVAAYAGWLRHLGKADPSRPSKGFPKRAIQGRGQHCCNLPGYGCATSRNQRWRVGSTSASRATAGAYASQRSWR